VVGAIKAFVPLGIVPSSSISSQHVLLRRGRNDDDDDRVNCILDIFKRIFGVLDFRGNVARGTVMIERITKRKANNRSEGGLFCGTFSISFRHGLDGSKQDWTQPTDLRITSDNFALLGIRRPETFMQQYDGSPVEGDRYLIYHGSECMASQLKMPIASLRMIRDMTERPYGRQ
jgi:hypothetical protein